MKDNWTIGYTPDDVVAVWVGNNDDTKMGNLVFGNNRSGSDLEQNYD